MRTVAFLSPHYGEASLRFVRQLGALDDVRLVGLGGDPRWMIETRGDLVDDYVRIDDPLDVDEITEALEEAAGDEPIHAFLTLIEPLQEVVAEVRQRLSIPGISLTTARAVRDKAVMKDIFEAHEIPCAAHRRIESAAEVEAFVAEVGLPVILKPLEGQGCLRTHAAHRPEELEELLELLLPSTDDPFIIEEFITGGEGSFDTLTVDGEIRFASVISYSDGPLSTVLDRDLKPIYSIKADWRDDPAFKDIEELGRRVSAAVGIDTSITHMEWYRRADGSLLVGEIGARPPGEPLFAIHNFAHDISLFQAWAELMVDGTVDIESQPVWNVACLGLRAAEPGIISRVHGVDRVLRHLSGLIAALDIPDPGSPTQTTGYMGEGKLFCRGTDYNEVIEAVQWAAGEIWLEVE